MFIIIREGLESLERVWGCGGGSVRGCFFLIFSRKRLRSLEKSSSILKKCLI